MDEWGTSIWDTPIDAVPAKPPAKLSPPVFADSLEPQSTLEATASFDDFDDFGEASQPVNDDDFGNDFGDFGEGLSRGDGQGFDGDFQEDNRIPTEFASRPSTSWEPLRIDPLPPPAELAEEVQEISAPIWAHINPEDIMTSADIRQVEGLGQVLVTPESRLLHQILFNVSPTVATRPPNWTRSRIRRQHLIALGIPINLDEVMPHANGKPLPMLNVTTTRPSSAPPGPRPVPPSNSPSGSVTRAGTPQPSAKGVQSPPPGFGPKPKLDDAKIAQMLELNQETLALLPLATLEAHLNTLRTLTSDTSSLLSHMLQTREALQQDSETYNGLIAELVGEAQKMKSGSKAKTSAGRRGSGMV